MCGVPTDTGVSDRDYADDTESSITSFRAVRLNLTTFKVVEDDEFGERPFIYVKVYPKVIVIIDTGCDAPRKKNVGISSLPDFLESVPVIDNGGSPINPGARLPYFVLLSHCHYDHIGGIKAFVERKSKVIFGAGEHLQTGIVSRGLLSQYTLHDDMGLPEPQLPPLRYFHDAQSLQWSICPDGELVDLHLQLFATPGHSVDSMVILDYDEKVAFMGDSAYEDAPLFYSYGSSLFQHAQSLNRIERELSQTDSVTSPWTVACGHRTAGLEAIPLLRSTQVFIHDVLSGRLQPHSIGKDHLGRTGAVTFRREKLEMTCPEELLKSCKDSYFGNLVESGLNSNYGTQ